MLRFQCEQKNKTATQAEERNIASLLELFKPHLIWNLARLKCFTLFVLAIIEQKTVSLEALSHTGSAHTKSASLCRRFQRFLAQFALDQSSVATLILSLLERPSDGWILAMDRTNWKFGKTHINILTVTVVISGMGFPIAWMMLPKRTKRGNSDKSHRFKVMTRVLALMAVEDIRVLTMDREFIGHDWLAWLDAKGIGYIVRVKKNALIGGHRSDDLCWRMRWKKVAGKRHEVFGQQVYFAAKRIAKGRDPYLAVISNRFHGQQALDLYRCRWGIENFFSHLKKRGFNFESTHLTKKVRLERLVAVLAVAFTLCHRWGEVQEKRNGKKLKKHGYRAKSLFRQGLDSLHKMVKRPALYVDEFKDFIVMVFTPLHPPKIVG